MKELSVVSLIGAAILIVAICAWLLFSYGTVRPCEIFKKQLKASAAEETLKEKDIGEKEAAAFAASMVLADALLGGLADNMTAFQCAKAALREKPRHLDVGLQHAERNRAEIYEQARRAVENADRSSQRAAQTLGLLRWKYDERQDQMDGGMIKTATVHSLNTVEFDFPYGEPQRAQLQIRQHPRYGKDVILSIDRGQFLCRMGGCGVEVRFDNEKSQRFSATEPADNSTTTIFIVNYERFLKGVRKSKKTSVEALFFQQGSRIFEFDTSGLVW